MPVWQLSYLRGALDFISVSCEIVVCLLFPHRLQLQTKESTLYFCSVFSWISKGGDSNRPIVIKNHTLSNTGSLQLFCCPCQTHHVVPQSYGHVSMSPFTEVEAVLREVGGVRSPLLKKNKIQHQVFKWVMCPRRTALSFSPSACFCVFVCALRTYSVQRNDGVSEKGLHDHSEVLSVIITASIRQLFGLSLREVPQTLLLLRLL